MTEKNKSKKRLSTKKLNNYISKEGYSVKNLVLKDDNYEDEYTTAYKHIKRTQTYNCEWDKLIVKERPSWDD